MLLQTWKQWTPYGLHPIRSSNTKGSVKGVEGECLCTRENKEQFISPGSGKVCWLTGICISLKERQPVGKEDLREIKVYLMWTIQGYQRTVHIT